jgi:NAD(P)-dependent dehydrogenase (short-subunit alcohol dehydrogenase family)
VVTAAPPAPTFDKSRDRQPAQIMSALDAKAVGFLRVAEAVAPHMVTQGSGRIVGVSGQNARLTSSITGSVRNQALITMAKGLADAYAGTGVGVNVVNPGLVSADASGAAPAPATGGASTPLQVSSLITYLASPASAAISGESIAVGHKVMGVAGA